MTEAGGAGAPLRDRLWRRRYLLAVEIVHVGLCVWSAFHLAAQLRYWREVFRTEGDDLARWGWSEADIAQQHENFARLDVYQACSIGAAVASALLLFVLWREARAARITTQVLTSLLALLWAGWLATGMVDVLSVGGFLLQATVLGVLVYERRRRPT